MKDDHPKSPATTHTATSGVQATEALTSGVAATVPHAHVEGSHESYEIRSEVARGGMGRILEALDRRHGRPVALKMLLRKDENSVRRFEREARITGRLQHPAIVPMYEAGTWSTGEPFFAMKLVKGASLDEVVGGAKSEDARLALLPHLIALTEAVAYAHREGVVHRDIKPANVLVGAFGETVLIDWGLAKLIGTPDDTTGEGVDWLDIEANLTVDGRVVGTPSYMSPEQARGEMIDARADVYALGACLYQTLSGSMPYATGSPREAHAALLRTAPPDLAERAPNVPSDLAAIVRKAMSRDRDDRYGTANEMSDDLRRFATGRLVTAHAYTLRQLVKRWLTKYRGIAVVASISFALLFAITVLSFRRIRGERDQADALRVEANEQQRAALKQRGAAEALVVTLLGDLRDKLIATGRLDILKSLAGRVLDYYKSSPLESTVESSTFYERATAMYTFGGTYELQLETESALKYYGESLRLYREAERIKSDPAYRLGEALSLFRIGTTCYLAHNMDCVLDNMAKARESILILQSGDEALAKKINEKRRIILTTEALFMLEKGMPRAATASLDVQINDRPRHVDDLQAENGSLAWAYIYRSQANLASGLVHTAEGDAAAALSLRESAVKARPNEMYESWELTNALRAIEIVAIAMGDDPLVERTATRAIGVLDSLIAVEPDQVTWKIARALHRARRGGARLNMGRMSLAKIDVDLSVGDVSPLSGASPLTNESQSVAVILNRSGELALAEGQVLRAKAFFERSLVAATTNGRTPAASVEDAVLIVGVEDALGRVRLAMKDTRGALEMISRAQSDSDSVASWFDADTRILANHLRVELDLARVKRLMGELAEAEALEWNVAERCASLAESSEDAAILETCFIAAPRLRDKKTRDVILMRLPRARLATIEAARARGTYSASLNW